MLRFQEISGNIESENLQTQIEEMERALKKKKQEQEIKALFEKYNVRRGMGKDTRWKLDYQNKTIRKTHEIDMYHYIVENLEEAKSEYTINEVFYAWIDKKVKDGEIKNDTAERYEDDFIKYLKCSRFADRDFGQITEDDIVAYVDDLKPLKLSATCFSNIKILLRGIWKYAKREKLTELSITYVLGDIEVSKKCFKRNDKDASTQIYYDSEIKRILDLCHNAPINEHIKNCKMKRLAIAVAIGTGVRISELATLKFSDIDFENGCIKLLRAQQREEDKINGGYRYFVAETKTEAGTRRIYVSDEVLRDIEELRKMPHQTEYILSRTEVG